MSIPRLPFLYPHLFRSSIRHSTNATSTGTRVVVRRKSPAQCLRVRARGYRAVGSCAGFIAPKTGVTSTSRATTTTIRPPSSFPSQISSFRATQLSLTGPRPRHFSTSSPKHGPQFVQRHGKAVEPFLPEGQTPADVKVFTPADPAPTTPPPPSKSEPASEPKSGRKEAQGREEKKEAVDTSSSAPLSKETQEAAVLPGDDGKEIIYENISPSTTDSTQELDTQTSSSTNSDQKASPSTTAIEAEKGPIETVLTMPAPASAEEENAAKPPHLQTPPYLHHFDTYTLVQQVEAGGFTTEQSITAMKAVRGLLAWNLDVAREGLVGKSDVENETYLFRAACSELKTEVENNRKKEDETMRRERTLLQHEVDILNQKLTQELLSLKDELKGMFDDRKMSVRSEQRGMESKIQELNYKITVLLNSDSKSEVEGLRWVLTRRSVMGILFMAFMVLTSLRYASYKSHEDEIRKKKLDASTNGGNGNGGGNGGNGNGGGGNGMREIEELPARGAAEILAAN